MPACLNEIVNECPVMDPVFGNNDGQMLGLLAKVAGWFETPVMKCNTAACCPCCCDDQTAMLAAH